MADRVGENSPVGGYLTDVLVADNGAMPEVETVRPSLDTAVRGVRVEAVQVLWPPFTQASQASRKPQPSHHDAVENWTAESMRERNQTALEIGATLAAPQEQPVHSSKPIPTFR
jgi:hypothetical protein